MKKQTQNISFVSVIMVVVLTISNLSAQHLTEKELLLSDGSIFNPRDCYPRFSWNTALSKHEKLYQLAKERIEYHLACFLTGAQPYSYFQYGWGRNLANGSLYDFPELQKPLGAPKGVYKRNTSDGWEFTREFEHASVWLDTENGEAKITWK